MELINALSFLLRHNGKKERIPLSWSESLTGPSFKKGRPNVCSNHHDVTLIPAVTDVLVSVVLRHLTLVLESNIHEQQPGFHPDQDRIDPISALH